MKTNPKETTMTDNLTTAEVLGRYRVELINQGFEDHEVFELVRDAARENYKTCGLAVNTEARHHLDDALPAGNDHLNQINQELRAINRKLARANKQRAAQGDIRRR